MPIYDEKCFVLFCVCFQESLKNQDEYSHLPMTFLILKRFIYLHRDKVYCQLLYVTRLLLFTINRDGKALFEDWTWWLSFIINFIYRLATRKVKVPYCQRAILITIKVWSPKSCDSTYVPRSSYIAGTTAIKLDRDILRTEILVILCRYWWITPE